MSDDLVSAFAFGADQPERFLTAWFGPPARPRLTAVLDELPEPLRRWHQLAGRWDQPLLIQNQVPNQAEYDGDLLVVGVETQAVWLWGADDAGYVFERENTEGARWTSTGELYDEFLWHFALIDAVFGGEIGAGASNVSGEVVDRLVDTWEPVDARPWRWPGSDQRLWSRDGVLAWTFVDDVRDAEPRGSSAHAIFAAARSTDELDVLRELNVEWDFSSGGIL